MRTAWTCNGRASSFVRQRWQLWMQQQLPAQLAAQLGGGGKRRRAGQEAAAAHTGWQQEAPGRASALG